MIPANFCLALMLAAMPPRTQEPENRLKPAATVPVQASLGELVLSADRAWVYLLNLSDGKLQRLDTAKHTLDGTAIDLAEFSHSLAAPPNKKTLYVAAAAGNANDGMDTPANAPKGTIQLVDAATFQLKRTHTVEFWPFSLAVGDSGSVFAAGKPRLGPPEIVILDGGKVGRKIARNSGACLLKLSPDQQWVYTAPGAFNRFSVSSGTKRDPSEKVPPLLPDDLSTSPYVLSPDGAFQVLAQGAVLKLVKARREDVNLAARIEPHLAALFDSEPPKLLLVTTADAMLKIYSMPGFALKRSYLLEAPLYRAALDGKSRLLYGAAHAGDRSQLSPGSKGIGNIHVYDLSKPLEEASQ